jgi:C4-dicarboxylate-specific signal transduction histidine kinase
LPPVRADITKIHGRVVNLFTNAWQALEGASKRINIRVEAAMLDAAVRMPVVALRGAMSVYRCA